MKGYYPFEEEHVCMPKYRLMFPFMWKDLIEGRAKRANRGQPKPVLLSSHKAHMMPVSGLAYLNEAKILVRYNTDKSIHILLLSYLSKRFCRCPNLFCFSFYNDFVIIK